MKCKSGIHDLIRIYGNHNWDDTEDVVRWCRNCGAIVIDVDLDGRVMHGRILKMKFPRIAYNEKAYEKST
jgi:hypothetical protein